MINTNISIRDAESRDISSIMELIYLKAEFDGCPELVQATPEKLKQDLFGEKPLGFVLLAEIGGNSIGFASYHFIQPFWQNLVSGLMICMSKLNIVIIELVNH